MTTTPPPNTTPTILLVEDDTFIAHMYTKKLSDQGFTVIGATDGEMALDQLAAVQPDIVLLDVMIPKVDGWHILEHMKRNPELASIPVIMLTNLGSEEDVKRGMELGAADYMIKAHFVPSEVVKKIKTILGLA